MESMPLWLQYVMRIISPTPHFVDFAQAVLYRGAGPSLVWQQLAAVMAIGAVYFGISLRQFRRMLFQS
jgi:ABC-2 type transport system permease protein